MGEPWPDLKRDYVGRRVVALRELRTSGGRTMPEGEVLVVVGWYRGLTLRVVHACRYCGRGEEWRITKVQRDCVRLLPEDAS